MQVQEVMTRNPETVAHDENAQQAGRRMAGLNVGLEKVSEPVHPKG